MVMHVHCLVKIGHIMGFVKLRESKIEKMKTSDRKGKGGGGKM